MRTFDRILAISDIHGEHDKFLKLLEKAEFDSACDLLVIGGDLIDRGNKNLATIKACRELRDKGAAVIIKGNHEQFAEECIKDMLFERPSPALQVWVSCNGGANSYDELLLLSKVELKEVLNFIESLPLYFTVGDYIFTHAGANTRKPIEKNTENELVWMENSFPFCPAYRGKTVIFGHIPTFMLASPKNRGNKKYRKSAKIWHDTLNEDKIGIDCGSIFGGRLAALELPSRREFYV